jgi:DNA topoisomerase II
LVFNKKKAEHRKEWLSTYDPNAVLPYDRSSVTYRDFINKEFIHFSNEDNQRSIASIIDGFKPGQRKIIYSCFKRNLKEEIKVAQLAGYVS